MTRRRMTEAKTEEPGEVEREEPKEAIEGTALTKWAAAGGAVAVSDEEAVAALAGAAQSHGRGGHEFLSFSGKRGTWELGRGRDGNYEDWIGVLDYRTLIEGWTCWKGGSPVGKVTWSVYNREAEGVGFGALQDHGPYKQGDGWSPLLGGMFLMFFADSDTSDGVRQAMFETNSKSGRNQFGDLQRDIMKRITNAKLSAKRFPLIEFGRDTFPAQGQTNYLPLFNVVAWATEEEVQAFMQNQRLIDDHIEATEAERPVGRGRR